MAGAIAGPLIALFLIASTLFVWRRKRKRRAEGQGDDERFEKPMLHSDSVPKPLPPEIADGTPPQELDGSAPRPAEVAGTVVVVQELEGSGAEGDEKLKGGEKVENAKSKDTRL